MSHENDFFNDLDGSAPQRTAPPPPQEESGEEEDRTPPQVIDPSLPMSAASSEGRPAAEEAENPKEDKVEMEEKEPNFNDSIPAESEKSDSEDQGEERNAGGGLEYYYNYTGGENQPNEAREEPLVDERRQTHDSHLSLSGEDHLSDEDTGVFRRHSGGGMAPFHPRPITTTVTPPSDTPANGPPQDVEDVEVHENIASAPSSTRSSTNNITNSTSPPPFSANMPTVPSFGDQPNNSYNVHLDHNDSGRGLHEESGSEDKYKDGDGVEGGNSSTSSSNHEVQPPFTQPPNNIDGFTFDSGVPAEFTDYRNEPQAPPTHVQHTHEAEMEAGVTPEAPEQYNDRMQEEEEPSTHVQHTHEAEMEAGVTPEAPEQYNDRMQEEEEPSTHVQHTHEAEMEAGVTPEAPEQYNDRMQEEEEPSTHVQHTHEAEMEAGVTPEAPEQYNDRLQEEEEPSTHVQHTHEAEMEAGVTPEAPEQYNDRMQEEEEPSTHVQHTHEAEMEAGVTPEAPEQYNDRMQEEEEPSTHVQHTHEAEMEAGVTPEAPEQYNDRMQEEEEPSTHVQHTHEAEMEAGVTPEAPEQYNDRLQEEEEPSTHVQHTHEAEMEAGVTPEAPEQYNDRMQEEEEPSTHVQHTHEAEMEAGVTPEAPEQYNDRMQDQMLTPNFSYAPTNFTNFQNNDNIPLLDTPEFSAVPPDRIHNPVTLPQEYQSYSAASNADDLQEREKGLEMTSSAAQIGSSQDFMDYNRSSTDVVQSDTEYNPLERESAASNGSADGEVIIAGGTEREESSAHRNEKTNHDDEEMKKSFTAFISKMRSQRESSMNRAHFHSFEEYPESVTEELAKVDNYFVSISDPRDGQFRHRKGSPFTIPYLVITRNVYVQALLLILFLVCWIMIVVQILGGGGSTCFFTFICMLLFTLDYILLFLFQKMDRFAVGNQYWRLSEPVIIVLMLIFEIVEWSIWAGAKSRNGAFIAFVILRFIGWSAHGYTRLEQFQYGLRCLCSADRRRYQAEGFDMDFAYIHRNIVAMAWPANNFEKLFRNSLSEVVTYLDRKHPQSYLVINLCSERTYNPNPFHHQTSWYPMDDHNPGELSMMLAFCKETSAFIAEDLFTRCLIIHCKGGKGRTGTLICALLMYMGVKRTADAALHHFARLRTKYGSTKFQGVQAPSQERYVRYFERLISNEFNMIIAPRKLKITRLRVQNIPHLWYSQGIGKLYFVVITKPTTDRRVEFISNNDVVFNSEVPDPSTYTKKQLRDLLHDDEDNLYKNSNVLDPNFANENQGPDSAHGYQLDTESFSFYLNGNTSKRISYQELHDLIKTRSAYEQSTVAAEKRKGSTVPEFNITLEFNHPERIPALEYDVVVKFFYARNHPNPLEAPVQVWFHTMMERENSIFFPRNKVDGPAKDTKAKRYPMDFAIDISVREVN